MTRSRFGSALTWSVTTRKAVEKAGRWKRWKTTTQVSHRSHPWKSRKRREIPTFPPPPRFALSLPNQRRRGSLEIKPDNSRVNKTGQLAKLTTEPQKRAAVDRLVERKKQA